MGHMLGCVCALVQYVCRIQHLWLILCLCVQQFPDNKPPAGELHSHVFVLHLKFQKQKKMKRSSSSSGLFISQVANSKKGTQK